MVYFIPVDLKNSSICKQECHLSVTYSFIIFLLLLFSLQLKKENSYSLVKRTGV